MSFAFQAATSCSSLSLIPARQHFAKHFHIASPLHRAHNRQKDEEELVTYLDPKERNIARRRMMEKREKERTALEKEMGMHLPDVHASSPHSPLPTRDLDGGDAESDGEAELTENSEQMLKRRKAVDEGNQPGIRRVAEKTTILQPEQEDVNQTEQIMQVGRLMTFDELLDSFIPDIEACQQWTLSQDLIFMR